MKHDYMKPLETEARNRRLGYWIVAIICLVYSGVALILSLQQLNFIYLSQEYRPSTAGALSNSTSGFRGTSPPQRFREPPVIPLIVAFSGSLISAVGGISLIMLLRRKESNEIKTELLDTVILPDEKLVLHELEKNDGELAQSELVTKTGLTKVKIHRIIKRLESMGIVNKYPYGLTNKIRLEKKYYD
jgi:uncharacterized membrane protein